MPVRSESASSDQPCSARSSANRCADSAFDLHMEILSQYGDDRKIPDLFCVTNVDRCHGVLILRKSGLLQDQIGVIFGNGNELITSRRQVWKGICAILFALA